MLLSPIVGRSVVVLPGRLRVSRRHDEVAGSTARIPMPAQRSVIDHTSRRIPAAMVRRAVLMERLPVVGRTVAVMVGMVMGGS